MLHELTDDSEYQDLQVNRLNTKAMMENDIKGQQYSDREQCKLRLPGTVVQHQRQHQDKVIQKRITVDWTAFAKHRKHIYNSCILLPMTYGAEKWTPITQA